MKFPDFYLKLFENIYKQLYNEFHNNKIHCFLCGSNDMDFRNLLKKKLENKDIKVIYAENLFETIVHNSSKENHLDLENKLASNVELILIVLESPGALVELGVFSNDDNHIKKLIVLMDEKFKKAESFINYGPIKKIKELDKVKRIFYYNSEGEKINTYQNREMDKSLKYFKISLSQIEKKPILDIVSVYYLLKIALFIYNPIDLVELNLLMNYLCTKEKMDICEREIELNIISAIYWLQKENYIKKAESERYKLTKEGILNTRKELYETFGTKIIDNFRAQALNYQLRIKNKIG